MDTRHCTTRASVRVLASPRTWVEGVAVHQLETTAQLPGMRCVVGMPDLHPGRGYPVGAAFFSVGRFYPALVGNDIGCGMALWQTDAPMARVKPDKWERRWGSIDGPLDGVWDERLAADGLADHPHRNAVGTVGGGNHFAEVLRMDRVDDPDAVAALGIAPDRAFLLVHSGSRGLGETILRSHTDAFGHAGLDEGGEAAAAYLEQHRAALVFAAANRRYIALRTMERLGIEGSPILDVHHNFVAPFSLAGERGWIHRKGATPSDSGAVVIPGSRGDHSYLVLPIAQASTLCSLAHGAGRKWGRADCKGRLERRYTVESLRRTALGGRVICADRDLLFEEAPEAYKPIDAVVGDLVDAGVARVVARLTPVLTYKTQKGGCCP